MSEGKSGSRRAFIGGNWKMNGSKQSVAKLVEDLNNADIPSSVDVVVAPTFLHLETVQRTLRAPYEVSAQNCSQFKDGAFTGDVSAAMLRDFGVTWTILGHSERRSVFGESNEVVAAKVDMALKAGLRVIACVGESLQERKDNKTMDVVIEQLKHIAGACKDAWDRVVIAYEPVWAIGTGLNASPAQAQEVHAAIRAWLKVNTSADVAASTRIIYGGSVKPSNCDDLMGQADVDGFLVGGASLVGADFVRIFNAKSA